MARYPTGVALLAFAALAAGCGPGKELPVDVAPPDSSTAQQQVVPAQSDPDAKAAVERAVKALTGGKPELLAKGKASRTALKGLMYSIEKANQSIDATRAVAAVWPDRFHSANESAPLDNRMVVEVWLHRPDLVVFNNGQPNHIFNLAEVEQNLASDVVGQHWMPLLLPATDPKAVVFDLQSVTMERRALYLLKVALGDHPIYQLTFDAKTDALVRLEYTTSDNGVPRRTTMVFADHKPVADGMVLPHRVECRHNNSMVEKWTVEKWEFPATIGDEQFAPPKKK